MSDIHTEIRGQVGLITLNRPRALNALSLPMIRDLAAALMAWRDDPAVRAVAIRGTGKTGPAGSPAPFGAFCAGGDIRFFHQAVLRGDAELEDFFTEEYSLNHLIHHYPKPYIAFMDGIVMGGGMGISQGARLRIVTERTKMAMPETHIGLFPDVGGGYFLSRCPGRSGEWLALTGDMISPQEAIGLGLADGLMDSGRLPEAWEALTQLDFANANALSSWFATYSIADSAKQPEAMAEIDHFFAADSVAALIEQLEAASSEWAQTTATVLRQRSPLLLQVTLEQIRRARTMSLADDLRMERDMVRHCFNARHLDRFGPATDTMEGIRALAVDKDHHPRWKPARIEEVTPDQVAPFFESPWPVHAHPLRALS
ncbi:MAG: enoyl-CoA hydratase/isomerase family protein [Gammaproteobacteria bacterium]|nr:enoyl-CoA hydratase/isomerase family protein [Gammaproteobacteria bacterium]MBU0788658.1 enoyl-CoA hydratase/isomerase family protein [Gammaproteobacteria bacterium]MBU0814723.1 enoyl-CoA hydratase/isomerase family protein [Gammaproteobacteria bacterium]MBU1786434.1 enoyl-CoA hydratase/isomerase family protein [Gammaproteobacteria bacterium]